MPGFIYNEQLFAEEAAPVAPSTEVQPTAPAEIAPIEQPKSINDLSRKEQIAVFEKFNAPKEPAKAPVQEPVTEVKKEVPAVEQVETPVADTPVETDSSVQTYTPEEIAETGIDKLDPKRLPEALQPYYKSMLADYTRKTQAVAEQRRQAEQVKPLAEQPRAKVIDRLMQERTQDVQQVERILNEGNAGEKIEFNEWDPNHAYLMKRVSDYRVYNERQQNDIVSKGQNFIQTEQADPDFTVMLKQAERELVALSGTSVEGFEMANRIVQANNRIGTPNATQADIELVATFWNNTKTKFKTTKAKPVAKVPVAKAPVATEQTGPSAPTDTKPKRFNPKSAAKMSKDQLKDLFGAFATKGQ